jgi:hypothetical protein
VACLPGAMSASMVESEESETVIRLNVGGHQNLDETMMKP